MSSNEQKKQALEENGDEFYTGSSLKKEKSPRELPEFEWKNKWLKGEEYSFLLNHV